MQYIRSKLVILALMVGLLVVFPTDPTAHDIPGDVSVHAFVKPEGERLRVLVRLPLEAMLDVNFPLNGPGYLDIEGARPLLPDAAMLWLCLLYTSDAADE